MGETDVLVVGAGPAGAACALALRRHAPALHVCVVDAGRDARRVGESLHPAARGILQHLGAWERFAASGHVPSHGTVAAWGRPTGRENDFLLAARGEGWHLDRASFDAGLRADAREAGAEVVEGARVTAVARECEGWRVTTGDAAWAARFLVDATGPAASVARRLGARRAEEDALVALAAFVPFGGGDARTIVEAEPYGWWYTSGLPGGERVVAAITDAEGARDRRLAAPEAWASAFTETTLLPGLVGEVRPERILARPCGSWRLDAAAGDGWLAVGDAATTLDPLSSQGLFQALRSGVYGAYAASDALAGRAESLAKYRRFVEATFAGYAAVRRGFYAEERRWADRRFWRARTA